ncbi:hypothetical protein CDD81_7534 [Ophiocordyceps australis]|uniref:PH domain-containing protein n=1 Tax=Ophiocordyceps australis TaxID=1399860 RepID=A0A2C5Y413_9HYPO|nr:hypothetical protein CDD81_7534 [Ophiocordyceps australis]
MASEPVHPLRIAKSTPNSSPSKMASSLPRPLSELSPTERRRNSPSWRQYTPTKKATVPGNDSSPFQSSPLDSAPSPRLFWQNRNAENMINGSGAPSPVRRSSLERLQRASRVKNSNILALEHKQEYDPARLPQIERPLAKASAALFASSSTSSVGAPLSDSDNPFVDSKSSRSTMSFSKSPPPMPLPQGLKRDQPSPTKSSLSPSKFNKGCFDAESGTWSGHSSLNGHELPEGRFLHRHAKSVTFDAAPPQVNEYEQATPDISSVGTNSRDGSYDSVEDPEHDEYEALYQVGQAEGPDDSFDESLEDTDKTPVVGPDDWRGESPMIPHASSSDTYEGSPGPQGLDPAAVARPGHPPTDSANSNGDHRPLPPLPGFGHARSQSAGSPSSSPSLSATAERMLGSHRSLPVPPPASASKHDIQSFGNSKMSLEERLRLMMLSDDASSNSSTKSAAEQQRERRLRRGASRERGDTPQSESESVASPTSEPMQDVNGDASLLQDFQMPPRISRESIMRRVDGNKALDQQGAFNTCSPTATHCSTQGSPLNHEILDPDVPIPSTEVSDGDEDELNNSVIITRSSVVEEEDMQGQVIDLYDDPEDHEHGNNEHSELELTQEESNFNNEANVGAHTPRVESPAQSASLGDSVADLGPPTQTTMDSEQDGYSDEQAGHSDELADYVDEHAHYSDEQGQHSDDQDMYSDELGEYSDEQAGSVRDQATCSDEQMSYSDGQAAYPDEQAVYSDEQAVYPDDQTSHSDDQGSGSDEVYSQEGTLQTTEEAETEASRAFEHRPCTPQERMSKPEYDGSGWGEPEDEEETPVARADTPDSVIHHATSEEEEASEMSPAIPERIATVKSAAGTKLKTRISNTPSDLARMREVRRQVSLEVPSIPPIPERHRNRISRDLGPPPIDSHDDYLERHPSFKNRSLTLDIDMGLSLDQDFERVIEGQKRGYLMRHNTKVVTASDKDAESSVRTRSANNSPIKQERPVSWVVEPWNPQSRTRSTRRRPETAGPIPPLPGHESNTVASSRTSEEDVQSESANVDGVERGRLFVKVMSVKDLDLPLPKNERTWFSLTLDNGVHCVTTAWLELARNTPIGQEFELVVPNDLEFQLTLNVRLEKPVYTPPSGAVPKLSKPKSSTFSRVFASPKKRRELEQRFKAEEERYAQQQREALTRRNNSTTAYELLSPLAAEDGSFARAYVCLKDHESRCYGRPYTAEVVCFNEWATEEETFASSVKSKRGTTTTVRRAPYNIGKLEIQLLFVPRPKNARDDDMPKSMNSCIRELKAAEERLARNWEGHLSQQGGDCPYWRRRYFKLSGTKLTAYHETTRQPRATINLSNAKRLIDDRRALVEKETLGRDGRRRRSAFAEDEEGYMFVEEGFRIRFNNGELIDFYADTAQDKDAWMKALSDIIGRPESAVEEESSGTRSRAKWCELVLRREDQHRRRSEGRRLHSRTKSSLT